MRILLASVLALGLVLGCSKKKDEAPAPTPASSASKPTEPKPADPTPVDEKPTPTEADKPPPPATGAPTKEAGIQRLKDVLAALEAKDWDKTASYFAFPAGKDRPKDLGDKLGKLIELKEISAKGIEILEAKGKWGKLSEVFEPERAARFAEKFGVPVADCWGFSVEGASANASVGFHWDGKELKLIRLNNVGKLEDAKGE